jgi:hypothetical protein
VQGLVAASGSVGARCGVGWSFCSHRQSPPATTTAAVAFSRSSCEAAPAYRSPCAQASDQGGAARLPLAAPPYLPHAWTDLGRGGKGGGVELSVERRKKWGRVGHGRVANDSFFCQ